MSGVNVGKAKLLLSTDMLASFLRGDLHAGPVITNVPFDLGVENVRQLDRRTLEVVCSSQLFDEPPRGAEPPLFVPNYSRQKAVR